MTDRTRAEQAIEFLKAGVRPNTYCWEQFWYLLNSGDRECQEALDVWVAGTGPKSQRDFLVVCYGKGFSPFWATEPEWWAPLTWFEASTVASKMTPRLGRKYMPLPRGTDLSTWKPERSKPKSNTSERH